MESPSSDLPKPYRCILHFEEQKVAVTKHAAERWAERVRRDPQRPITQICKDIELLAGTATSSPYAPEWWTGNPLAPTKEESLVGVPDFWIMFGPDIAMPVRANTAVTVLERGSMPPGTRAWRTQQRLNRKMRRRVARKTAIPSAGKNDKWRFGKRKKSA